MKYNYLHQLLIAFICLFSLPVQAMESNCEGAFALAKNAASTAKLVFDQKRWIDARNEYKLAAELWQKAAHSCAGANSEIAAGNRQIAFNNIETATANNCIFEYDEIRRIINSRWQDIFVNGDLPVKKRQNALSADLKEGQKLAEHWRKTQAECKNPITKVMGAEKSNVVSEYTEYAANLLVSRKVESLDEFIARSKEKLSCKAATEKFITDTESVINLVDLLILYKERIVRMLESAYWMNASCPTGDAHAFSNLVVKERNEIAKEGECFKYLNKIRSEKLSAIDSSDSGRLVCKTSLGQFLFQNESQKAVDKELLKASQGGMEK
ncbi:hypothetical protein [Undibacterium fentianense]|uniref:Lysozyme inhibitor LprI N-terminal domain-containing protein n=1 Tax=Undibacterium fentianense TaxID=2828728 RepID=A0A941E3F7_9BURK|nr:hypothetical protein [Undibacterium fentianense]MBR7800497.1 hypothetical protein [Undibacterium fentianense]